MCLEIEITMKDDVHTGVSTYTSLLAMVCYHTDCPTSNYTRSCSFPSSLRDQAPDGMLPLCPPRPGVQPLRWPPRPLALDGSGWHVCQRCLQASWLVLGESSGSQVPDDSFLPTLVFLGYPMPRPPHDLHVHFGFGCVWSHSACKSLGGMEVRLLWVADISECVYLVACTCTTLHWSIHIYTVLLCMWWANKPIRYNSDWP